MYGQECVSITLAEVNMKVTDKKAFFITETGSLIQLLNALQLGKMIKLKLIRTTSLSIGHNQPYSSFQIFMISEP